MTSTITSASPGKGYSAAILGGTAAAIAGGLIVIGAVLLLFVFRRRHKFSPQNFEGGMAETNTNTTAIAGARTSTPY